MEFTGEQYLPSIDWPALSYEHWHRYLWASRFVAEASVLDIASGEGFGSNLLANTAATVVGVDASLNAVQHASSMYHRPNLQFYRGTAGAIPIQGTHIFDVVVSFETIEHLDEAEALKFMSEVKRLLKPGGVLLISTPNKLLYSDKPGFTNEYHLKEFYLVEFVDFLKGFFRSVAFLGQRVYPISYIWPLSRSSQPLDEYQLQFVNQQFKPVDIDKKEVLYMLAVCSDQELEIPSESVLLDISGQLIAEKEHYISALKRQVEEQSQALQEFQKHLELLAHADKQNRELQLLLKQRNHIIEALKTQLVTRNHVDRSLSAQIEEQDHMIRMLRAQMVEKDQELGLIHGSRSWRLVNRYWRGKGLLRLVVRSPKRAARQILRRPYHALRRRLGVRRRNVPFPMGSNNGTAQATVPIEIRGGPITLSDDQLCALTLLLDKLQLQVAPQQLLESLSTIMTQPDTDHLVRVLNFLFGHHLGNGLSAQPASIMRASDVDIAPALHPQRRNLLFITGEFPNPLHGGGARVADLIKALSSHYNIYLYTWYTEENKQARDALHPYCADIMGVSLDDFENDSIGGLNQLIAGVPIDVVHYEWPRALRYYHPRLGDHHVFTYTEPVSLRMLIDLNYQPYFTLPWLGKFIDLVNALDVEIVDVEKLDALAVLTRKDGEFLARFNTKVPYYIIDTGINLREFEIPEKRPERNAVVFIGGFRHYPNEDAVVFFFDKIYSQIKAQIPSVKVYIVGAHPTAKVLAYHDNQHVIVTGTVDDIKPYIQRAAVCIAPLITGAGIRTKVNQYAALRRVCVATSIAAVDLAYEDGKDIFITDDPSQFAERVIYLLQHPDVAQEMSREAYKTVHQCYGLEVAAEGMRRLHTKLIATDMSIKVPND